VPNAIVTLVDVGTGLKRTTAADDAGEYSFASLPPGRYRLQVNHPGFAVYQGEEYALDPKLTPPAQNIVLEPGSVMQAVDVTAKAPSGGVRGGIVKGVPQRIRVGGLVQTTMLVKQTKPEYPEGARAKGIQGVVLLEGVISKEGAPLSLKVLSSPEADLSKSAMDAVKQWRYDPTLLNGEPIEVVTTIAVRFRLAP
jgi:TonB family protein